MAPPVNRHAYDASNRHRPPRETRRRWRRPLLVRECPRSSSAATQEPTSALPDGLHRVGQGGHLRRRSPRPRRRRRRAPRPPRRRGRRSRTRRSPLEQLPLRAPAPRDLRPRAASLAQQKARATRATHPHDAPSRRRPARDTLDRGGPRPGCTPRQRPTASGRWPREHVPGAHRGWSADELQAALGCPARRRAAPVARNPRYARDTGEPPRLGLGCPAAPPRPADLMTFRESSAHFMRVAPEDLPRRA